MAAIPDEACEDKNIITPRIDEILANTRAVS